MKDKIRVGILCGGVSAEHGVSLLSASNIINGLDRAKYEPVIIGISEQGRWQVLPAESWSLRHSAALPLQLNTAQAQPFQFLPREQQATTALVINDLLPPIDVIFPVLHGPLGEDGTIQGLLKIVNIPFVGPGVLASSVCMDKAICKRLLSAAGFQVADFIVLRQSEYQPQQLAEQVAKLGWPVFVKPANLGSSVGINRATSLVELEQALQQAWRFDHKIVVEQAITGRELECGVLGHHRLRASVPGEIIPQHDFYSYTAKYLDPEAAKLVVPAKLAAAEVQRIQDAAIAAFRALECSGMARVDFFLTPDDNLVINEVNTIPGFTDISMYPAMWQASGVSYSELLDELIQLAITRYQEEQSLLIHIE